MQDIPEGVLLLYAMSKGVYTIRSYSTTAREFTPNRFLHPKREFVPEAPLLVVDFKQD